MGSEGDSGGSSQPPPPPSSASSGKYRVKIMESTLFEPAVIPCAAAEQRYRDSFGTSSERPSGQAASAASVFVRQPAKDPAPLSPTVPLSYAAPRLAPPPPAADESPSSGKYRVKVASSAAYEPDLTPRTAAARKHFVGSPASSVGRNSEEDMAPPPPPPPPPASSSSPRDASPSSGKFRVNVTAPHNPAQSPPPPLPPTSYEASPTTGKYRVKVTPSSIYEPKLTPRTEAVKRFRDMAPRNDNPLTTTTTTTPSLSNSRGISTGGIGTPARKNAHQPVPKVVVEKTIAPTPTLVEATNAAVPTAASSSATIASAGPSTAAAPARGSVEENPSAAVGGRPSVSPFRLVSKRLDPNAGAPSTAPVVGEPGAAAPAPPKPEPTSSRAAARPRPQTPPRDALNADAPAPEIAPAPSMAARAPPPPTAFAPKEDKAEEDAPQDYGTLRAMLNTDVVSTPSSPAPSERSTAASSSSFSSGVEAALTAPTARRLPASFSPAPAPASLTLPEEGGAAMSPVSAKQSALHKFRDLERMASSSSTPAPRVSAVPRAAPQKKDPSAVASSSRAPVVVVVPTPTSTPTAPSSCAPRVTAAPGPIIVDAPVDAPSKNPASVSSTAPSSAAPPPLPAATRSGSPFGQLQATLNETPSPAASSQGGPTATAAAPPSPFGTMSMMLDLPNDAVPSAEFLAMIPAADVVEAAAPAPSPFGALSQMLGVAPTTTDSAKTTEPPTPEGGEAPIAPPGDGSPFDQLKAALDNDDVAPPSSTGPSLAVADVPSPASAPTMTTSAPAVVPASTSTAGEKAAAAPSRGGFLSLFGSRSTPEVGTGVAAPVDASSPSPGPSSSAAERAAAEEARLEEVRKTEEARLADLRKAEEEATKKAVAEEARMAERRAAEEARLEELRVAEEARVAAVAKAEEEAKAEATRREAAERKAAEEARLEEARKAEEAAIAKAAAERSAAEEARRVAQAAEEARMAERRAAEEARLEALRVAEEARLAAEEEAMRREAAERAAAEKARLADLCKAEEETMQTAAAEVARLEAAAAPPVGGGVPSNEPAPVAAAPRGVVPISTVAATLAAAAATTAPEEPSTPLPTFEEPLPMLFEAALAPNAPNLPPLLDIEGAQREDGSTPKKTYMSPPSEKSPGEPPSGPPPPLLSGLTVDLSFMDRAAIAIDLVTSGPMGGGPPSDTSDFDSDEEEAHIDDDDDNYGYSCGCFSSEFDSFCRT